MWRTCKYVSRPCELVFPIDLSLTSFHSVAVRFAIMCSEHSILVNLNVSTVAQLRFDCICLLVPVATGSSVFIWSKFYCLESVEKYPEGKIHKTTLFIRGNTRNSCTESVYDKRPRKTST